MIFLSSMTIDGRPAQAMGALYTHQAGQPAKLAIQIVTHEGPFMRLTVNMGEVHTPGQWAVHVKTWSENEPYIDEVLQTCPWLERAQDAVPASFGCSAEVWNIIPAALSESAMQDIMRLTGWDAPAQKHTPQRPAP